MDKYNTTYKTKRLIGQNSLAQNAKASSHHSHSQITTLGKNSRTNPLKSSVTNLQFSAILAAHLHVPSRTFHHPANPPYSILLLSDPLSTPSHHSSQVLQPSHIHKCATSLERSAP